MPRLDDNQKKIKMNQEEINNILSWFDTAVSKAEDVSKEEIAEFRKILQNSLAITSALYYDFYDKFLLNNSDPENNKASSYLETKSLDSFVANIAKCKGTATVKPLMDGLKQMGGLLGFAQAGIININDAMQAHIDREGQVENDIVKDTEKENTIAEEPEKASLTGEEYLQQKRIDILNESIEEGDAIMAEVEATMSRDRSEFIEEVIEIRSNNVDRKKMNILKERRADKEAFEVYLQKLEKVDPAKAAYCKAETARWQKENEKLDKITFKLLDAKHQAEVLRLKYNQNRAAFTKEDQKALDKAKKQDKVLNKKSVKIRDKMMEDYNKYLKKHPCPYDDVVNIRKKQIPSGDFRYVQKLPKQELDRIEGPEKAQRQVDFGDRVETNHIDKTKQTDLSQVQRKQPQTEKEEILSVVE